MNTNEETNDGTVATEETEPREGPALTLVQGGDVTTLAKIEDLPDVMGEGNQSFSIVDKAGIATAFDQYAEAFRTWDPADRVASGASRAAAIAELRIRARILRSDGSPMLAGDSGPAWKAIYSDRIKVVVREFLPDDDNRDNRLKKFQGAVRTYRTNRGLTHAIMSERLVETENNLAATKVVVGKVAAPTKREPNKLVDDVRTLGDFVADMVAGTNEGMDIPTPLKEALAPVYEAQKTREGNRLQGFETVPDKVGPRPTKRQKSDEPDAPGNVGSETVKGAFDKLRGVLATEVVDLASDAFAEDLYRLATSYGDALIGAPDQAGRFKSKARRKETVTALNLCARYIEILAAFYENNGESDTLKKDAVNEKRYAPRNGS